MQCIKFAVCEECKVIQDTLSFAEGRVTAMGFQQRHQRKSYPDGRMGAGGFGVFHTASHSISLWGREEAEQAQH